MNIVSYASMINHFNLVLSIDNQKSTSWSISEVISRSRQLNNGIVISKAFAQEAKLNSLEYNFLDESIAIWREGLINIGWFIIIFFGTK